MPGQAVPFRWISELPAKAQEELERNFLALQEQIGPALTIFDAIIDSEAASSDTATHTYKNLTDLVANESWASGKRLNVGVKQGPTAIVEPGSVSITQKIALFGIGSADNDSTPSWQWRGAGGAGANMLFQGLHIDGVVGVQVMSQGTGTAIDCWFGSNITGFNAGGISGQDGECFSCTFDGAINVNGSIGVLVSNRFFNCNLKGGVTCGGSQGTTKILGGVCAGYTHTAANTGSYVIADLSGGSVTITNGGGFYIHNTANSGNGFTLTACSGDCEVLGIYGQTVHFDAAATSGQKFTFNGAAPGLFVNGGVQAVCSLGTAFVGGRLTVQGKGNMIVVNFIKFTNPAINFVGGTHSQVHATVTDLGGAGEQAYAFDAASHNNILILSGFFQANLSTPSTNLGANNRVITEMGDTLVDIVRQLLLSSGTGPGEDGLDGEDFMIPGPQGIQGKTGSVGLQGSAVPGEDGNDGEDFMIPGPKGDTGKQGATGIQGRDIPGDDGADGEDAFPMYNPPPFNGVPIGSIVMWGSATIPPGWQKCDGTALKRTEPLFAVIGTTFGTGDGSTTFNVPDLRDRVPRGANTSALGVADGAATHLHTIPDHSHPLSAGADGTAFGTMTWVSQAAPNIFMKRVTTASWTATVTNSSALSITGSSQANTTGLNVQGNTDNKTGLSTNAFTGPVDKGLNVNFIIKL